MRDIPASRRGQKKLRKLLRQRGYTASLGDEVGEGEDEVALSTCIWCGNPNNNCRLNVYKRAVHCWACSKSSRLEPFLKRLINEEIKSVAPDVDETAQGGARRIVGPETVPLYKKVAAQKYWFGRGLTEAQAHRYNVGVCVDEDHPLHGRIVIPLREYWSGELFGFVGRLYTSGDKRYLNHVDRTEVAGFRERDPGGLHILVEGPFDALRVDQAGLQAGALLGSNVGTARSWMEAAPPEDDIVIILDGDAEDRTKKLLEIGRRVRGRIGEGRTVAQRLPAGKDPADYKPSAIHSMVKTAFR